jgi:diguanylate cyclase (GGDEF)-like protein/PAS domain S-box-containing protein
VRDETSSGRAAGADLRALVDANADGMLVCDPDGRIRYANPAAATLLGRPPDELVGEDFGRPLRLDAMTEVDLVVDARLVVAELRAVETVWEDAPAILATLRDVTQRKLVESDLRRANRVLQAVIEAAPVAIAQLDEDGAVTSWNEAAEAMLGWAEDEVLGRRCPLLPERMGIPGRRKLALEVTVSSRDERPVDIALHTGPVLDDLGEVTGIVAVAVDISDRKRREERVRYLASHDPLTGLANRRVLEDELGRIAELRGSPGRRAADHRSDALLILDLDEFKVVNDTAGHLAGDEMLTGIARLVRDSLRPDGLAARLGGDELAVLLRDVPSEDAEHVAERLRARVADYRLQRAGRTFSTTATVGGTLIDEARDPRELIAVADLALKRAKRAGRNRTLILVGREREAIEQAEDARWAELIRAALRDDLLVVDLLPLIDLESLGRRGLELLVRLPEGEDLHPPALFLERADSAGLLAEIDLAITRKAIDALADPVALPRWVNLSRSGLAHDEILDAVAEADPRHVRGRLGFDIGEDVLFVEAVRSAERLSTLRARGCSIALDRFTGQYPVMAGLGDLAVDVVKLDSSLVPRSAGGGDEEAVVRAVVESSRAHNREVVAVGIEREETRRRALRLGVTMGQGHLWPSHRILPAG